ncbi:hypothetical protein [Pseudomonas sp. KK4]|uniref:hypothetical protein n=1 Tax=Pseudomonas sp. KK4 TaxID=1855729 RepID=UPI00097C0461|nr:hypothetical protein [Pseudomonas sp. KK4]
MNNKTRVSALAISSLHLRVIALALIFAIIPVGTLSLYWLWEDMIPIYGRIYRNAPVVETPYLVFCLLMGPPALLLGIIGASITVWTGKKFNPPNNSFLHRFSALMMYLSVKTMFYIVPAIMTLTTLTLLYRDYTPCPKLLISGSAWQLFWVNDENACFKPTRYINDHWPCKMIGEQEVCIQVDGK